MFYFSKNFKEKVEHYLKKGYQIVDGEANFIVLWYDKAEQKEYRIVLPILYLQKG